MMKSKVFIVTAILAVLVAPVLAQSKSAKRGVCWDEKTHTLTQTDVELLAPGVSWVYTWGESPKNAELTTLGPGGQVEFVPMCWNGGFNETKLRQYLADHPGVKYLLGFNEPNFADQSNMTPQAAAKAWPKLEQIATDYGLKLVAPALNFTGTKVGGKYYQPYDWYDEFFAAYPEAHVDYLAMHCYMNTAEQVNGIATEYFYKNLYDTANESYGKYPHLVKYLDEHQPLPMFLTEFCAWDDQASITDVYYQIDQMTRKLQLLEKSPLVAGYAWFMANGNASTFPYFSLTERNTADAPLSELGKVFVYMSSFDADCWHPAGSRISAVDYIDASGTNYDADMAPRLRANTDEQCSAELPVMIGQLPSNATIDYQVDLPAAGDYLLTLRYSAAANSRVRAYCDGERVGSGNLQLAATGGQWAEASQEVTLPAGHHTLRVQNFRTEAFALSWLQLTATSGIAQAPMAQAPAATLYYTLQGVPLPATKVRGICLQKTTYADGTVRVQKVNK